MSSHGSGNDGDQDHERQRPLSSHSGIRESVAETRCQAQIRGPRMQTVPRDALANKSDKDRFSQSSGSAPNKALSAENNSAALLHWTPTFVQQETHRPVAIVQPQPRFNSSDIYGQRIPTLRQTMVRGPQFAVANTPTTFAHMRDGPKVTNILQQTNCSPEVSQTRQLDAQVLSGKATVTQGRGTTQVLGRPLSYVVTPRGVCVQQQAVASVPKPRMYPPVPVGTPARAQGHQATQLLRPPGAINTQWAVAASVPKYGAHNSTHQGNIATETQIPMTPEVSQTRQLGAQVLSGKATGAQGRGTTQVLGRPLSCAVTPRAVCVQQQAVASVPKPEMYPPVPVGTPARAQGHQATQLLRPPCAINRQWRVAASVPKYGAHNSTHQGNIAPETQIPMTPATETRFIQHYQPESNAIIFNPMQQQQTGYAMQQTFGLPTEHDMTLKAGANYNVAQPFTASSGEDQLQTTIYVQHKGVQGGHNQNTEPERTTPKQVSAVPNGHQTQHAQRTASNIAPVTPFQIMDLPVNNVTDRHQVNYPPSTIIPPQQLKMVQKAGYKSEFTNPCRTYTEDKSIQVNIGLQHQENIPFRNPNNEQRLNTTSYNSPATSSQISSTVGDTPELIQEKNTFTVDGGLKAQAQEIFKQFALDPKNRNKLTSANKFIFSNWMPRDDIERQELQHALDVADYLFTKGTEGHTSHEYILQLEDQAENRAGDIPLLTNANALPEREEGNSQTSSAQEQANPACKSSDITEEGPSPQKLDASTGNQMSTKTDANSAANHPSTSEPQRARVRPAVGTYYFHAISDYHTSDTNRMNKNKKFFFIFNSDYINYSSRSSGATNLNKFSFVIGVVSDAWLKAISSQLGEAQAAGSPANMRGENFSNGGCSLQLRENSEVTYSCMTDSDLDSTPKAVDQQRQITETCRERQKRHYDLNEATTAPAKKQIVVRVGTELQCAPSSTTLLPHHIDSDTLSVKQKIADDAWESGALSLCTGNVLSYSDENTLGCDSLNDGGRVVDNYPLKKENEITIDERRETVSDECVSVIQKLHYEHKQDDHGKYSIMQSHNKDECFIETMAIPQQLPEASSDYKETEDNVDDVTSDTEGIFASHHYRDCHMEVDEVETQTAEDEDEEKYDDGSYVTAIPVQQKVEEQEAEEEEEVDFPPDVPQANENVSDSDEHEEEDDTDTDSGLSVDQEEVKVSTVSTHIKECSRVLNEIRLILQSIQRSSHAAPVEPSTSDSTPMIETKESQKGHVTNVEHELDVETQYAEDVNASNIHVSGKIGKVHDVVVVTGDGPDKTSREAPVTFKPHMTNCQERITEESCVFWVPAIKQDVTDTDAEEESDMLHEETDNECEQVEGEDSSRSEMASHHAPNKNTDNDVDNNVTTENKAAQGNITSNIEDITMTDHSEAQLKEENEGNSPLEDLDHNYSRSSNISDVVVVLISIGEEASDERATI